LKVAQKLELGPILQQEMLNFKQKIDPITAHDSYSAWREQDHDDLVLAVALAAWRGEQAQERKITFSAPPPAVGNTLQDILGSRPF
jgi:ribonuclease D